MTSEERAMAIEEVARKFERTIGWHNDECTVAKGHPWYACDCEVKLQATAIRDLKDKEPSDADEG